MFTIIGIMGPGESAGQEECTLAFELGELLASEGHVVLTGGRNCGVMHAAMRGAKSAGGITIGLLPEDSKDGMSEYVDIPVLTGMGHARNIINVLSSQLIIAIGEGAGTFSEVALAAKTNTPVIWLKCRAATKESFDKINTSLVVFPETENTTEVHNMLKKMLRENKIV